MQLLNSYDIKKTNKKHLVLIINYNYQNYLSVTLKITNKINAKKVLML